jgi:hypothetical protein
MSVSELATTISGALAVLAAIGATLRWIIKKYLSELRPNGGSSLRDSINRLEDRVDKIYEILLQRGE